MENESPVKIMEQEAIETIEELWSELFSVRTKTDIDNFCTDRNMKRALEDPNNRTSAKSSRNGSSGNLDPLPSGYKRGLAMNVLRLYLKRDIPIRKARK